MARAAVVVSLVLFGLLGLAACSDDTSVTPQPVPDPRPPTPAEWDRAVTRLDEAAAAASRDACKFTRGALPEESLGAGVPTGKDIPIETIVVLMQENRSFDHYFGHFGKYAGRADVESAPESASNPDAINGAPTHAWHHAEHMCFLDTNHAWDAVHTQYDDAKMDGFFQTNHDASVALRDGSRAMSWY